MGLVPARREQKAGAEERPLCRASPLPFAIKAGSSSAGRGEAASVSLPVQGRTEPAAALLPTTTGRAAGEQRNGLTRRVTPARGPRSHPTARVHQQLYLLKATPGINTAARGAQFQPEEGPGGLSVLRRGAGRGLPAALCLVHSCTAKRDSAPRSHPRANTSP